MEDKNLIGQRIREAREASGFTQVELAEKVGVAFQSIQQWESGRTTPRTPKMRKLATVLNRTPMWLQFGVGSPTSEIFEDGLQLIQSSDFKNQVCSAHSKAMQSCISLGWVSLRRSDISFSILADIFYSKLLEEYGLSAIETETAEKTSSNQ